MREEQVRKHELQNEGRVDAHLIEIKLLREIKDYVLHLTQELPPPQCSEPDPEIQPLKLQAHLNATLSTTLPN